MTHTTDTQAPAVPSWLAKAEASYQNDQLLLADGNRRIAERINNALAGYLITPDRPAQGTADAVYPAVIVQPDYAEELYGVEAEWDKDSGYVRLRAVDYMGSRGFGSRPAGRLTKLADIARIRHNGPTGGRPHDPTRDLRTTALGGVGFRPYPGSSVDSAQVCEQLAAVTAALLHLADTVTRGLDRP